MQFQIKRDVLLKSLSIAHNIIERKNTLPILSNVLLEIKNNKLNIVATDFIAELHGQHVCHSLVVARCCKVLLHVDVFFTACSL